MMMSNLVLAEVGQHGSMSSSRPRAGGPTRRRQSRSPLPQLQVLQLPASGVGREGGQPVAVDVVEAELGSRVGPFPTDDHPHPFGPGFEVEESVNSATFEPSRAASSLSRAGVHTLSGIRWYGVEVSKGRVNPTE